ncbi:hypothetical protein NEPAR05_0986 [Nematocida parisii]|nr:hypothetical protein NEPAR05_0986 [Nematocida parisii]
MKYRNSYIVLIPIIYDSSTPITIPNHGDSYINIILIHCYSGSHYPKPIFLIVFYTFYNNRGVVYQLYIYYKIIIKTRIYNTKQDKFSIKMRIRKYILFIEVFIVNTATVLASGALVNYSGIANISSSPLVISPIQFNSAPLEKMEIVPELSDSFDENRPKRQIGNKNINKQKDFIKYDEFYFNRNPQNGYDNITNLYYNKIAQNNKMHKSHSKDPKRYKIMKMLYGIILSSPFNLGDISFLIRKAIELKDDENSKPISMEEMYSILTRGIIKSSVSKIYLSSARNRLIKIKKCKTAITDEKIYSLLLEAKNTIRIYLLTIVYDLQNVLKTFKKSPFSDEAIASINMYNTQHPNTTISDIDIYIKQSGKFNLGIGNAEYLKASLYNTVNQLYKQIEYVKKIVKILYLDNRKEIYAELSREITELYSTCSILQTFNPHEITNIYAERAVSSIQSAIDKHFIAMRYLGQGITKKLIKIEKNTIANAFNMNKLPYTANNTTMSDHIDHSYADHSSLQQLINFFKFTAKKECKMLKLINQEMSLLLCPNRNSTKSLNESKINKKLVKIQEKLLFKSGELAHNSL